MWTVKLHQDDHGTKRAEIVNPSGSIVTEHRPRNHPDVTRKEGTVDVFSKKEIRDAIAMQYRNSQHGTQDAADALFALARGQPAITIQRIEVK